MCTNLTVIHSSNLLHPLINVLHQNRLGGLINWLNQAGIGKNIYCVLWGRMTPDQKQIVCKRSKVGTQLYIDILTWFVKESGHSGYLNTSIPEDCPQPLLVGDVPTKKTLTIQLVRLWKLTMKAGQIISPLHKTHRNTHRYMVLLIFLPLQCFSNLHQLYWHTVVHMPKMWTWKLKMYCHLHFLLVLEDPQWNKEWRFPLSYAFRNICIFPWDNLWKGQLFWWWITSTTGKCHTRLG